MREYPVSRETDVTDDYFGTVIKDPYRWLEDDNSEETKEWVAAQNKVTEEYFSEIGMIDSFKNRIEELMNYPKLSMPDKTGKYHLYYKNNGVQNQSVIYVKEGADGKEEILLDPNEFSEDGTTAMYICGYTKDGKYVAISKMMQVLTGVRFL